MFVVQPIDLAVSQKSSDADFNGCFFTPQTLVSRSVIPLTNKQITSVKKTHWFICVLAFQLHINLFDLKVNK